ncbi:MAG: gluconokinase, GntK/IdnK-type [Bacteroidota bacterium]
MRKSTASPNERRRNVRVLVVAGPAGSGKTTVGQAVADRLGWAFVDADDLHTEASRQTMARGEGLTDADRAPWLARLAALVRARTEAGSPTVLACSALTRAYREQILTPGAALVWLHVPREVLRARLGARTGHIAGPSLLPSQLADAEPPADGESAWTVDGTLAVDTLAAQIARLVSF